MADIEREEMIEQAHKLYDNSRNLISELRWQRTYFCRGTNIISKEEKLFNIWIFDECLKRLEERKVGKWEYKQLGFRKYGVVCTSCGYAMHIGYDFTSMEEFKDMVERKLQNPHITMDKYCRKCGAEMKGTENE
jgi:hypothetical protein